MRTRVSAFCDAIIEAGWLLALVVVPLFFNVYSDRVFEPDKLGLLRSVAALMAIAWLVKWSEERLFAGQAEQSGQEASDGLSWRTPLVLPTLLLALVYLLTTIISVVPRISLWGSYQRLQGTYTTFSYLVVFSLLLQNLRRHSQRRRLLTTMILTSLPIALYGLLQHYDLDPLPWGGNVTVRVAGNMGNAIFLPAYLIMVVPLTLARGIRLYATTFEDRSVRVRAVFGAALVAALFLQSFAWAVLGFSRGFAVGLIIIIGLGLTAAYLRKPMARFVLLGCYVFVLTAQLVCIFYSGSRGPWLGLLIGLYFFGLLYIFSRRWRKIALIFTALSILGGVFLVIINLPGSPLGGIRDVPYVGRLGRVFEIEGGTGRVRVLIWGGAVEMLGARPMRTIVGYGPESMYMAYNPYYPPDLAHYERRNASPDRSHNETFDALIMTGIIGFLVYMFLFSSIFYYGLGWLGLIRSRSQFRLFVLLSVLGALLGVLIPLAVDGSLRFAGVGLPLGFVLGVSVYVTVSALGEMLRGDGPAPDAQAIRGWRLLLLVGLLASVIAHFVEIHFGIAIAATRTYFWTCAAMIVVVGQGLVGKVPVEAGRDRSEIASPRRSRSAAKRSRKQTKQRSARPRRTSVAASPIDPELPRLYALAAIVGLILSTMAWDYTTNPTAADSPIKVLVQSLMTMAAKKRPEQISLGMFWMFLATFVIALLLSLCELVHDKGEERSATWWLVSAGRFTLVSLGTGGLYALIHAARLGPGLQVQNLIYEYYGLLFALWLILSFVLYRARRAPATIMRGAVATVYPIVLVVALLFVNSRNIHIVSADVLYKQGKRFDGAGVWDKAIHFYQQAIDLAPHEDFYYLFLGRALMEQGKLEGDVNRRDAYFDRALDVLREAKRLNPLNTDHTANMGRLYRTWGEMDGNAETRRVKLDQALEFYDQATFLSPHNAQLYNEWGLVYYILGDHDLAMSKYEQSLALDQEFAQTHLLMGDLHLAHSEWQGAISEYEQAVEIDEDVLQGWSAMAYAYSQMGETEKAIEANLRVLELVPADYVTLKNLAILYVNAGNTKEAVAYARAALERAPDKERSAMQGFLGQIEEQLVDQGGQP